MQERKMEIIQQLMEELQSMMEPGAEDFGERLGRPKPEVEVTKIEGELPIGEEMEGEMPEEAMMEESSPEDKLKSRLMKLRG